MVATQSIQNFVLSITLAMTRLPVLAGRHHEPTMQKRSEEKKNDRIAMQVLSHRVCHQKSAVNMTMGQKLKTSVLYKNIMSLKNKRCQQTSTAKFL